MSELRIGNNGAVHRLLALMVMVLAVGCSTDGGSGSESTTSSTAAAMREEVVREREQRFFDVISQSSGIATDEMLEQGYDLCATFAAEQDVLREDLTLDWASANDVDPARARVIADAAGRELCP